MEQSKTLIMFEKLLNSQKPIFKMAYKFTPIILHLFQKNLQM